MLGRFRFGKLEEHLCGGTATAWGEATRVGVPLMGKLISGYLWLGCVR